MERSAKNKTEAKRKQKMFMGAVDCNYKLNTGSLITSTDVVGR